SFENQLQTHLDLSRDEFIYIHTSQTFYEPGTDMYGTIWMFNANNKSFSGVSEFVELEILDPSGKLISSRKVAIYNGSGVFNFRFPQVSGLYTLRAKSVTNGLTFDKIHIIKQVQVQKIESSNLLLQIQADKPIYQKGDSVTMTIQCLSVLGQIPEGSELEYDVYLDGYAYQFGFLKTDNHGQAIFGCRLPKDRVFHSAMVQFKMNHQGLFGSQIKIIQLPGNGNQVEFYPESGLITEGLPAKVAFKLKDKYGVSKMGKGVLVNSKNEIITSVSTVHEGMGVFCFTPVAGLQYRLLIIDSEEQIDTFDLNGIRSKGCVMHVNQVSDSGIFIDVTGQLDKARLFARMGDNLVKRVDFNLDSFRRIFVPVSQLPMGIVQLSLFDSTWSLLGQRLVFVNYNKRLRVNYTFSRDNYDINEMVKLGIEVKDERGRPVTGMAAISVYQNDLYLASDPLAGNALSELYITQELKNKVDRPAYYFKREFPLALAHLDLLMLCSESVRLPYRDLDSANKRLLILNNTKQQYVVRGRIFNRSEFEDADFYYPLIRVICLNNKQYFRVDSNGYFEIVGIPTDAELNFKVEAPGQHGHKFSVKPWKIVNDITKQAHVQWYIENDLDSFKI
ncbi:MAG: hypothetical protein JNM67_08170, partial [Bacteroidetes bacterium]|nr:hypothetical protein [Bacteroidota bacterium]